MLLGAVALNVALRLPTPQGDDGTGALLLWSLAWLGGLALLLAGVWLLVRRRA